MPALSLYLFYWLKTFVDCSGLLCWENTTVRLWWMSVLCCGSAGIFLNWRYWWYPTAVDQTCFRISLQISSLFYSVTWNFLPIRLPCCFRFVTKCFAKWVVGRCAGPVSYTHLDVYKRQVQITVLNTETIYSYKCAEKIFYLNPR